MLTDFHRDEVKKIWRKKNQNGQLKKYWELTEKKKLPANPLTRPLPVDEYILSLGRLGDDAIEMLESMMEIFLRRIISRLQIITVDIFFL